MRRIVYFPSLFVVYEDDLPRRKEEEEDEDEHGRSCPNRVVGIENGGQTIAGTVRC